MGNKSARIVKTVEKMKVDPYKGRIVAKEMRTGNEDPKIIYTTKEDYDAMMKIQSNPLEGKKDLEELSKLSEKQANTLDEETRKEMEQEMVNQGKVTEQEQILSGKRVFSENKFTYGTPETKGFSKGDVDFLNAQDETSIPIGTKNLEDISKNIIEEKLPEPPKLEEPQLKRKDTYNPLDSIYHPNKLDNTFRANDLVDFYSKLRRLEGYPQKKEELINQFMKDNKLERKIVENLLKFYITPITIKVEDITYGLWNIRYGKNKIDKSLKPFK